MLFKAIKWMIHPETLEKMTITSEMSPRDLVDQFHPSQLERRFGGEAETPKQFWPPYVGQDLMPDGKTDHLDLINRDEYESTLAANPSLECHPQFLQPGQQSRDFVSSEDGPPQSSQSLQTEEQGFQDSQG